MKVSVIIPALNEEQFLPLTLKSLAQQTYSDFEIIVKDGLSKDRTLEIAREYADRVISCKDISAGDARNQGARYARGEILVFLDADTSLARDALERIVEDFERFKPVLIIPRYLPREEVIELKGRLRVPQLYHKIFFELDNLHRKINIFAGTMCMPCDSYIFKEIGGFNPNLQVAEDVEISRRLKKRGRAIHDYKIVAYPSARRYMKKGLMRTWVIYLTQALRWRLRMRQEKHRLVNEEVG
jgi:glycosyltransferase involved in cell wall biosynthesis